PRTRWAAAGEFCAIKDWHPLVAGCEETKDGADTFRILTLKDGGKIKEKLTDQGDTSYSYEIVESPLPVKNYKAKFWVEPDDEPADKSQYTLFNPTPANCLREFDPDRPDVTDSPFTVDAGHIQFESGLFSYALSRPDRQDVVTEEFDILDTNIRLGITNYAEIDLGVPPLDIEHKRFPISRFDTWRSGPARTSCQNQFLWERQF